MPSAFIGSQAIIHFLVAICVENIKRARFQLMACPMTKLYPTHIVIVCKLLFKYGSTSTVCFLKLFLSVNSNTDFYLFRLFI